MGEQMSYDFDTWYCSDPTAQVTPFARADLNDPRRLTLSCLAVQVACVRQRSVYHHPDDSLHHHGFPGES